MIVIVALGPMMPKNCALHDNRRLSTFSSGLASGFSLCIFYLVTMHLYNVRLWFMDASLHFQFYFSNEKTNGSYTWIANYVIGYSIITNYLIYIIFFYILQRSFHLSYPLLFPEIWWSLQPSPKLVPCPSIPESCWNIMLSSTIKISNPITDCI